MRNFFQQRFQNWLSRRIPPARNLVLNLRNIFIIPNQQGLGFALLLVLMFVGAINYEINLAFALVFLLSSLFVLTIFYTFRNLSGLHVCGRAATSVFAGENAELRVILNRHGRRFYESMDLSFAASKTVQANLIEDHEQRLSLYVPTHQRGAFSPGRLRIESCFPFGICRAWSLLDLDINCLVYPQPVACELVFLNDSAAQSGKTNINQGSEDFYSLREYQHGDSLKHVAWKKLAKGQGMYTKQYASHADDKIWLNCEMFSGMDGEARLSRLCYCVLNLDAAGKEYGLSLPDLKIAPGRGNQHYHKVLKSLALYQVEPGL